MFLRSLLLPPSGYTNELCRGKCCENSKQRSETGVISEPTRTTDHVKGSFMSSE
jgi:hypothetical protein